MVYPKIIFLLRYENTVPYQRGYFLLRIGIKQNKKADDFSSTFKNSIFYIVIFN